MAERVIEGKWVCFALGVLAAEEHMDCKLIIHSHQKAQNARIIKYDAMSLLIHDLFGSFCAGWFWFGLPSHRHDAKSAKVIKANNASTFMNATAPRGGLWVSALTSAADYPGGPRWRLGGETVSLDWL